MLHRGGDGTACSSIQLKVTEIVHMIEQSEQMKLVAQTVMLLLCCC